MSAALVEPLKDGKPKIPFQHLRDTETDLEIKAARRLSRAPIAIRFSFAINMSAALILLRNMCDTA
jgi:hypothetical protein